MKEIDNPTRPKHNASGEHDLFAYFLRNPTCSVISHAMKYLGRAGKKYPDKEIEDLDKAIECISRKRAYLVSLKEKV